MSVRHIQQGNTLMSDVDKNQTALYISSHSILHYIVDNIQINLLVERINQYAVPRIDILYIEG